jgi:hypothetical protein
LCQRFFRKAALLGFKAWSKRKTFSLLAIVITLGEHSPIGEKMSESKAESTHQAKWSMDLALLYIKSLFCRKYKFS